MTQIDESLNQEGITIAEDSVSRAGATSPIQSLYFRKANHVQFSTRSHSALLYTGSRRNLNYQETNRR